MMNPNSPERIRQDCRLIRQTLLKLAWPRLVARAIVIAVAVLLWLYVAQRILAFGATIDYQGLHALGQQTVDLLTRVNPYLWWAAAIIWTLLVFFAVRGWLRGNIELARVRPVPADTFAALAPELCDEVVDVMRWCWGNREEPFTVGDLQRTLWEVRHRRIDKIAMVREQEALLGASASPTVPARAVAGPERYADRPADRNTEGRGASRSADSSRAEPAIEPRIGPPR